MLSEIGRETGACSYPVHDDPVLEDMSGFFTKRVDGYDEHMIANVEGCKEGYPLMASLIPAGTKSLLDLGCGTGLELDEIFKLHPDVSVTAVDLCRAMLDKITEKHPNKAVNLICDDYFTADFGSGYDCAVSFETMHHFTPAKKAGLYRKLCGALADHGCYIECDYMVDTQPEEDHWFAENLRIRAAQNIPADAFFHYDTPCTIENQKQMLLDAGFASVELVFRKGGTAMLVAKK
jgi:SAM-dependent methyltransferase